MALGNDHARRVFRVPASSGGDQKSLEAQCAEAGHLPSGPAKRRVCRRCGESLPLPSLSEISAMMAARAQGDQAETPPSP